MASSALFLGDNFDFICQIGNDAQGLYIFERFQGAFKQAYAHKSGSIYILDGKNFKENQTSWSTEVVSSKLVKVLEENKIDDVESLILELINTKKITFYAYPNMPKGVPKDKSDIIERAVVWTMEHDEGTLEKVLTYHPDVLITVLNTLVSKGYVFKTDRWRTQSLVTKLTV